MALSCLALLAAWGCAHIPETEPVREPAPNLVSAPQHALPADAGKVLDKLHERYKGLRDGKVADYIPELAKAAPGLFGIALVTVDGEVLQAGDTNVSFTLQSVSKPFVLARALADLGREKVTEKVGMEATGFPFNSMLAIEVREGALQNPLVNAGAMAVTSLIKGETPEERYERAHRMLESFAGGKLTVDEKVFASEMATDTTNRALVYRLKSKGLFYEDVTETVSATPGPSPSR